MNRDDLDLGVLAELRERYLNPSESLQKDYWRSRHELEQYHATFGQRIGWKWRNIVGELKALDFPSPSQVVDYGCGTGIAALEWTNTFPAANIELWDRSALATQFAEEKIQERHHPVQALLQAPADFSGKFVLLSHLANELSTEQVSRLIEQLKKADGFCWVEPGTPFASQLLVSARKRLLETFQVLAPCPHQGRCGLESSNDAWCHHFAKPAEEAFHSAFWKKFSDSLKIDLRSLPTSYLAMHKGVSSTKTPPIRVLGRPRVFKGYGEIWACRENSVAQIKVLKKNRAGTLKRLARESFSLFLEENEI